MYMSYCRFEGTFQELQRCLDEVQEHADGTAEYAVSERECDFFREMIKEVVQFMHDNELLDEDGDLDVQVLDELCEKMKKGEE